MFAAMDSFAEVGVTWDQLVAHVSNVMRCASPWVCPVCTPVIREERAAEIDEALTRHLAAGGGGLFATFTVRHHLGDGLGERLDSVLDALHWVLKGAAWRKRAERFGYLGLIRAVEVTWSPVNGWHPHVHAALLFARPLTADEQADVSDLLFTRWAARCRQLGFGELHGTHGVDTRALTRAGIGRYVQKVEGPSWSVGRELARGDRKPAGPFAVLQAFVTTGETRWHALWMEYERATFGRRAIQWSPGLRAKLAAPELSDADVVTVEAASVPVWRYVRWWAEWNAVVRAGEVGDLLSEIEHVCGALKFLGRMGGHGEPLPVDDPRHGTEQEQHGEATHTA